MLADWYEELAQLWLDIGKTMKVHVAEASTFEARVAGDFAELARQCSLRVGRYARLADQAKKSASVDLTNVSPLKKDAS